MRLLPVVQHQPGRLVYRCRTVIHVRSRLDMEAGEYNVKLTTLYDSKQHQSYIRDEVAKRHALRYVRVPERTVNLFPAAAEKTTKLYILDVKPRSPAGRAESEVLSCYGIEGGQRTLPEEFGANELRQKFAKRPGRLSNANVAQGVEGGGGGGGGGGDNYDVFQKSINLRGQKIKIPKFSDYVFLFAIRN